MSGVSIRAVPGGHRYLGAMAGFFAMQAIALGLFFPKRDPDASGGLVGWSVCGFESAVGVNGEPALVGPMVRLR